MYQNLNITELTTRSYLHKTKTILTVLKIFGTKQKRPYYTVLNKNKFKTTFEVEVPYWRESLQVCLKHIKPSDE